MGVRVIIALATFFFLDYRLVIICSNEEEEMSHFISKLHPFRRHFISDPQEYEKYLASKCIYIQPVVEDRDTTISSASMVDKDQ